MKGPNSAAMMVLSIDRARCIVICSFTQTWRDSGRVTGPAYKRGTRHSIPNKNNPRL